MLSITESAHNSWKHDVTKQTPHELLLGFKPQYQVKFLPNDVPAATDRVKNLQDTRQKVQKLLEST